MLNTLKRTAWSRTQPTAVKAALNTVSTAVFTCVAHKALPSQTGPSMIVRFLQQSPLSLACLLLMRRCSAANLDVSVSVSVSVSVTVSLLYLCMCARMSACACVCWQCLWFCGYVDVTMTSKRFDAGEHKPEPSPSASAGVGRKNLGAAVDLSVDFGGILPSPLVGHGCATPAGAPSPSVSERIMRKSSLWPAAPLDGEFTPLGCGFGTGACCTSSLEDVLS